MSPLDLKTHLKTLVETHAPSGHEATMQTIIREAWRELVDDFQQDKLGNLVGIKHATRTPADQPPRRIMLAAHVDEIGLMVREIVDGFVFVHRLSGIDNRVMLAQPVLVHGKRPLPGVVASAPPHLLTAEQRRKYPSMDELVIDLGLPAEEVTQSVRIGDLVTPDTPMLELLGQRAAAKALDDRACVAAVTLCLDELQKLQHTWDVYATATVQEEMGVLGAKTGAYFVKPDIAIALDVTFGKQPGVNSDDSSELGGGPVLGLGPNFHLKLNEQIRKVAKYHELKLQDEPLPGNSGTDAWAIQIAHEGIPTALLSIPIRNMHSPVETVDLRDIERTGRLLAQFIASLTPDFLATIEYDHPKVAIGRDDVTQQLEDRLK